MSYTYVRAGRVRFIFAEKSVPRDCRFSTDIFEESSFAMIPISDPLHRESSVDRFISELDARPMMEMEFIENPFFSDQMNLTNQITQVKDDALSYIYNIDATNEGDTRFKRDISRARRDCEMSAERCGMLLQTMESYLKNLKNNVLSDGYPVPVSDILKCLKCKTQLTDANKFNEDPTPRSQDQYFSHDYVEQNRSSDSNITAIKLLDNEEAKQAEVNRTEAAKVQMTVTESLINDVSQDSANQSSKNIDISKTTTTSVDRTNYNGSQVDTNTSDINISSTTSINDEHPDDNLITIDSRTMRIQSDESSSSAVPNADQQTESEGTSETVTLQFDTTESGSTTQYTVTENAISKGTIDYSVESTETNTRYTIDLTKQITIAENVTSMPAGYDVTGIDSDDDSTGHPSVQPSFEGHPENQSATTINGTLLHRKATMK